MPERADTLEAIGLIIFAPLLYSMFSVWIFGFKRGDFLHQHQMVMYRCWYEYTTILPIREQAHPKPA